MVSNLGFQDQQEKESKLAAALRLVLQSLRENWALVGVEFDLTEELVTLISNRIGPAEEKINA